MCKERKSRYGISNFVLFEKAAFLFSIFPQPAGSTGLKTKDDVDDLVQSILKERSRTPVAAASGGDSDGSDKGTTVTPPVSIPAQLTSPSASVPQRFEFIVFFYEFYTGKERH